MNNFFKSLLGALVQVGIGELQRKAAKGKIPSQTVDVLGALITGAQGAPVTENPYEIKVDEAVAEYNQTTGQR